jgi:hypothetical protein
MTDNKKSNRRKRAAITAILLLLALLIGWDRCTEKEEPKSDAGTSATTNIAEKHSDKEPHKPQPSQLRQKAKRNRRPKVTEEPVIIQKTVEKQPEEEIECMPSEQPVNTKPQPEPKKDEQHVVEAEEPAEVFAPSKHRFAIGVRAGAGYSSITSLGGMTESYNVRPQFTLKEKGSVVFRGGIYGTWRYGMIGAELGVDYMRLSGSTEKHTATTDLTEKMSVGCDALAPQLMFRFYPYDGFYMSAGAMAVLPFHTSVGYETSRTGTIYRQQDELAAKHLRETVSSNVQFAPALKIGYTDKNTGLEAAVEYDYGATDLLHTNKNEYGYTERCNNSHYIGVSIGYTIDLNKKVQNKKD